MRVLNRAVLVLKPKQPYIDWANRFDDGMTLTLESARQDCTALLMPDYDDDREVEEFVADNVQTMFAMELHDWNTDPSTWPTIRDLKTFREWFDVEVHSMVIDTVDEPLRIEDL